MQEFMAVMACLEYKSKQRTENKNPRPSLCPKCRDKWFALYGSYAAALFFGGEAPLERQVLVKASFFDDLLSDRLRFELKRLRDHRGYSVFYSVSVDPKLAHVPENSDASFASESTQGDITETDILMVRLQSTEEKLTIKIIRVEDNMSRDSLRFEQDWDQAHFLRCPDCSKFSGMRKKGVIRRTAIDISIPTFLYPVHRSHPAYPTKISEVLKLLGLNLACNYGFFLPPFLEQKIRTKNSSIWDNTMMERKTEFKFIKKCLEFYFEQNSDVFWIIGLAMINLDLDNRIVEDPTTEIPVEQRIERKAELIGRLRGLLRQNQAFNDLFHKLAGFVICLFGEDPRFIDLDSDQYAHFPVISSVFLGDRQSRLNDSIEDCIAQREEGRDFNLFLTWIFQREYPPCSIENDVSPSHFIQVG